MGYQTDFDGSFTITPPLPPERVAYLQKFNETRRMKRDATRAETIKDPIREAVGLPIGPEGAYFVGGRDFRGQEADFSVINQNTPPAGQPDLWCKWIVSDDGQDLLWDGGEKFYNYVQWLDYLNDHFFKPWGHVLDGEIFWSGEDDQDQGVIRARNGEIRAACAAISHPEWDQMEPDV
jgi:hypothetical protein